MIIERTRKTPYVSFDVEKGMLEITGSLLSTDSQGFFEGLFTFARDYIKTQPQKTVLKFTIEYFNTSSSKLLLNSAENKFNDNPALGRLIFVYSELLENSSTKTDDANTIFTQQIALEFIAKFTNIFLFSFVKRKYIIIKRV